MRRGEERGGEESICVVGGKERGECVRVCVCVCMCNFMLVCYERVSVCVVREKCMCCVREKEERKGRAGKR